MINVTLISDINSSAELATLTEQLDMNVLLIEPTILEDTLEKVLAHDTDINVIDQSLKLLNADVLSHFLAKHDQQVRNIILINEDVSFEMLQNSGFSAHGYISREQRPALAKAVRVINDGEAWLPRLLVAEMLTNFAIMHRKADTQLRAVSNLAIASNKNRKKVRN